MSRRMDINSLLCDALPEDSKPSVSSHASNSGPSPEPHIVPETVILAPHLRGLSRSQQPSLMMGGSPPPRPGTSTSRPGSAVSATYDLEHGHRAPSPRSHSHRLPMRHSSPPQLRPPSSHRPLSRELRPPSSSSSSPHSPTAVRMPLDVTHPVPKQVAILDRYLNTPPVTRRSPRSSHLDAHQSYSGLDVLVHAASEERIRPSSDSVPAMAIEYSGGVSDRARLTSEKPIPGSRVYGTMSDDFAMATEQDMMRRAEKRRRLGNEAVSTSQRRYTLHGYDDSPLEHHDSGPNYTSRPITSHASSLGQRSPTIPRMSPRSPLNRAPLPHMSDMLPPIRPSLPVADASAMLSPVDHRTGTLQRSYADVRRSPTAPREPVRTQLPPAPLPIDSQYVSRRSPQSPVYAPSPRKATPDRAPRATNEHPRIHSLDIPASVRVQGGRRRVVVQGYDPDSDVRQSDKIRQPISAGYDMDMRTMASELHGSRSPGYLPMSAPPYVAHSSSPRLRGEDPRLTAHIEARAQRPLSQESLPHASWPSHPVLDSRLERPPGAPLEGFPPGSMNYHRSPRESRQSLPQVTQLDYVSSPVSNDQITPPYVTQFPRHEHSVVHRQRLPERRDEQQLAYIRSRPTLSSSPHNMSRSYDMPSASSAAAVRTVPHSNSTPVNTLSVLQQPNVSAKKRRFSDITGDIHPLDQEFAHQSQTFLGQVSYESGRLVDSRKHSPVEARSPVFDLNQHRSSPLALHSDDTARFEEMSEENTAYVHARQQTDPGAGVHVHVHPQQQPQGLVRPHQHVHHLHQHHYHDVHLPRAIGEPSTATLSIPSQMSPTHSPSHVHVHHRAMSGASTSSSNGLSPSVEYPAAALDVVVDGPMVEGSPKDTLIVSDTAEGARSNHVDGKEPLPSSLLQEEQAEIRPLADPASPHGDRPAHEAEHLSDDVIMNDGGADVVRSSSGRSGPASDVVSVISAKVKVEEEITQLSPFARVPASPRHEPQLSAHASTSEKVVLADPVARNENSPIEPMQSRKSPVITEESGVAQADPERQRRGNSPISAANSRISSRPPSVADANPERPVSSPPRKRSREAMSPGNVAVAPPSHKRASSSKSSESSKSAGSSRRTKSPARNGASPVATALHGSSADQPAAERCHSSTSRESEKPGEDAHEWFLEHFSDELEAQLRAEAPPSDPEHPHQSHSDGAFLLHTSLPVHRRNSHEATQPSKTSVKKQKFPERPHKRHKSPSPPPAMDAASALEEELADVSLEMPRSAQKELGTDAMDIDGVIDGMLSDSRADTMVEDVDDELLSLVDDKPRAAPSKSKSSVRRPSSEWASTSTPSMAPPSLEEKPSKADAVTSKPKKKSKPKAEVSASKPRVKWNPKAKSAAIEGSTAAIVKPVLKGAKSSKKSVSVVTPSTSRSRSTSMAPNTSRGSENGVQPPQADNSDEQTHEDEKLYCICRQLYDETKVMIACDRCDEWYHTRCVRMSDLALDLVDQWFCPICIEKHPDLNLKTTYKQRCMYGVMHPQSNSAEACHNPSRGTYSKYCSDECGIKASKMRINEWKLKGGDEKKLRQALQDVERKDGVVHVVEPCSGNLSALKPMLSKAKREAQQLRVLIAQIDRDRKQTKNGITIIGQREELLSLAIERAAKVGMCGWDQRLCFADEDWVESAADVFSSYNATGNAEVDGVGEWWCTGLEKCDRHAGWQNMRKREIELERAKKNEALENLAARERQTRKKLEELEPQAAATPKMSKAKLSNGHSRSGKTSKKRKEMS